MIAIYIWITENLSSLFTRFKTKSGKTYWTIVIINIKRFRRTWSVHIVPLNWMTISTTLLKPPVSNELRTCCHIRDTLVTREFSWAKFSTPSFLSSILSRATKNPKDFTHYCFGDKILFKDESGVTTNKYSFLSTKSTDRMII